VAAPLIIRKYKNRRLYDTERSRHVTRDELLELIRTGRDVQIEAAGSGEDVTAETILQMLLAEDGVARSVFTSEFVHFLVRTESGMLGRFFREVLPTAMRSFQVAAAPMVDAQTMAREQMAQMAAAMPGFPNPWGATPFSAFMGQAPTTPPAPEPESEPDATQAAFAALQQQMAALQAKLEAMEEGEEPAPKKKPRKKKAAKKKSPRKR
jgi:polyhydroxyalkanoate synthesis repressor PhaR